MKWCTIVIAICVSARPHGHCGGTAPLDLSEARVRALIANIEEGCNADDLKYGYFLRRRRDMFSKTAAARLVDKELAKLEEGKSKRWFLLASVTAFAHARVPGLSNPEDLYTRIFSYSGRLKAYPELMRRILGDFVALASWTNVRQPRRMDTAKVSEVVATVLPQWLRVDTVFEREPDIAAVSRKFCLQGMIRELIEEAEGQMPDSFAFTRRVGLYYYRLRESRPEKALSYLSKSRQMSGFLTQPEQVRRKIFRALSDVCLKLEDHSRAIAYQEESVRTCGGSRASLADLHHQSGDATSRDRVLTHAVADMARRTDVVPVAQFLCKIGRQREALVYLERFAGSTDTYDEHRLSALLHLIALYEQTGDSERAKALAFSVKREDYPVTTSCAGQLGTIDRIRQKYARQQAPAADEAQQARKGGTPR